MPDLGPYAIDYTKNGRFLLLGGRKGHLALMDTLRMDIQMEVGRSVGLERGRKKNKENVYFDGYSDLGKGGIEVPQLASF